MNDAEYIKALQHDLAVLATIIEQRDRQLAAAKETIKATVALNTELEQRVETMRHLACEMAKRANQQQRVAAGEKE